MKLKKISTDRKTLNHLLKLLKPYTAQLVLSVLLSAVSVAGGLYLPVLVGRAIDCLVTVGSVDLLLVGRILLTSCAVAAVMGLCQWCADLVSNKIVCSITRDVRRQAFAKIQILPLSFMDSNPTGDLVSRVIADADTFADGLLLGFSQLFTGIATIIGTLYSMFHIKPLIALAVVVLTPMSFVVARFIATHTHDMFTKQATLRGRETAFLDEILYGQKVVKAFGRESETAAEFSDIDHELTHVGQMASFYSSLTNPATRFVNSVVYAVVALVGSLFCIASGNIAFSVGDLSALLSYASQYGKPFNEISGVVTELQNSLTCAKRIFDLIDEQPETPDSENAAVLKDIEGDVEITDLFFSYDEAKPLIENFSLHAKPGMRVAIVGPTGCGKTTVINLLMRFYDPQSGSISVDGTDTLTATRQSLRASYGMVLQDTWLKSGTVKQNIAMGKPDATDEEIVAAAKAAYADGFIRRLPNSYDTVLSEDGGSLSAGQKQLLCIARIMLKLPPMLILDEATSSIDTLTEQRIQRAFDRLMKGRTSFVVAHRLSTIRESDIILVMKAGKIIEQGRHEELLEKGGFYSELYNSQFAAEELLG